MTPDRGASDAEERAAGQAWELLRTLAARGAAPDSRPWIELAVAGTRLRVDAQRGEILGRPALPDRVLQMLDLCLPLCLHDRQTSFVYAHLGQSLDGQIATASGASRYVTSPENLLHMHRLRALADAVVVGAGTVERDDPQLTTRLVPGRNPVRVIVDPDLRVPAERRVFRDGQARTIVVCRTGARASAESRGSAELLELSGSTPELAPAALVEALGQRGLRRLFIEGGGVTVSRFLSAKALDRFHVTVCPVFIGRGRPGVMLPGVESMEETLRPIARRFLLGQDVLFDCSFPEGGSGSSPRGTA